ncbi:hypothetical protein CTI12_AA206480 [Artemisia annua]|uniref:Uncharacterized protein n=1 Tax=Artemisia annua TaxID=35608 RepID=A0A2U1P101_ARTAN|nr:hypothetical protein CTI12_AA206480 [Artemisia annua]
MASLTMSAPTWKMRKRGDKVPAEQLEKECEKEYEFDRNLFTIRIHHGGAFVRFPDRDYMGSAEDIIDRVDIDVFSCQIDSLVDR